MWLEEFPIQQPLNQRCAPSHNIIMTLFIFTFPPSASCPLSPVGLCESSLFSAYRTRIGSSLSKKSRLGPESDPEGWLRLSDRIWIYPIRIRCFFGYGSDRSAQLCPPASLFCQTGITAVRSKSKHPALFHMWLIQRDVIKASSLTLTPVYQPLLDPVNTP